ncbi:hypothetical protein B0O80DRAFT_495165 [Mortierella sp. GBAus27b]|nr:hypothetical protein B0O80DRAFT_495165 [Mortierella sp. GBAus27b]
MIPRRVAPLWARNIHSSSARFQVQPSQEAGAQPSEPVLKAAKTDEDDINTEPPSEGEITARAYDFPWLCGGSTFSSRISRYPYPKAPKIWSMLGLIPQGLQYMLCKSSCERMLRNNTSPEYYPDQFLRGAGLAMHQLLPLLSTNIDREALTDMMTQKLYDRFESELQRQEEVGSDVSIKLSAVHDGMVKDVWLQLGPKLSSGSTKGFIRWRWQSLTIALRAATDEMSSRDQVANMMLEGVQFKVDVEFDATIDYTIKSKVLDSAVISDFTRRPLLVRFETPYFQPAEEMLRSRSVTPPDEAPIDWNWRISDIDYLLEQDYIEVRKREDIQDEEHAQREMGV